MNAILNLIVVLCIVTITDAQLIKDKIVEGPIDIDDNYWVIKLSRTVNKPTFPAYIRFWNRHTAQCEVKIDTSKSSDVLYYNYNNQHEIIFLTKDHLWTEGDSYYITMDEGVFFSDPIENSTEYANPSFWEFYVISPLVS